MERLWDAGLDYLTMTFKAGHKDYVPALLSVKGEMEKSNHEQEPKQPFAWNGYRGEKQGMLVYGEREDGLMVRCSGARTRHLGELLRERKLNGKATRIDFQATAKITKPSDAYLSKLRAQVEAACGAEAGRYARNTTAYKIRGGSSGMAIGSRSSQNYLRVYDKHLEQGGRTERGLIRFENEVKGARAEHAWKMYAGAAQPYYISCSIVKAEMELIGVRMDWLATGEKCEFPSSYEPTTLQKQANWLFKYVRPTVQAMVAKVGKDTVLDLLGLD